MPSNIHLIWFLAASLHENETHLSWKKPTRDLTAKAVEDLDSELNDSSYNILRFGMHPHVHLKGPRDWLNDSSYIINFLVYDKDIHSFMELVQIKSNPDHQLLGIKDISVKRLTFNIQSTESKCAEA